MAGSPDQGKYRELLLSERSRILTFREGLDQSWHQLQEPDRELEERAQKDNISRGMEDLDTLEKERIEDIDKALRNLESGNYGICENCGGRISDARLEAIPWTTQCIQCAGGRPESESPPKEDSGSLGRDLDPDFGGMSCREREDVIKDEIREDGRVDTQEFRVRCDRDKTLLQGYLPSEEEHQILLEILEDRLGLRNLVDQITINRQLWERADRAPGEEQAAEPEKETLMEGEREKEQTFTSLEDGTTTLASDEFIPEKPE